MIYDISPPITDDLKVWPGDTPPTREVLCDMARGGNLTLSTLRATAHLGAHADAPSHYGADAPAIDQRSLAYYLGPCQVITVKAQPRTRIEPSAITVPITAERVLIHTGTYPDPHVFNDDFAAPAPSLIEWLADSGVRTVGIDTPSVDLFDSKDLASHLVCLNRDMAILEGLVLSAVLDGTYELISLPLPLVGFDASPVRAVLRTLD